MIWCVNDIGLWVYNEVWYGVFSCDIVIDYCIGMSVFIICFYLNNVGNSRDVFFDRILK